MEKYATIDQPWKNYDFPNGYNLDIKDIQMSVNHFLWNHVKTNYDLCAINWFDHEISYKELKKNIYQTAQALLYYGVKEGDIITVCSVCTPEIIYLFYALDLIGAMGNFVDPRTSVQGLHEYVEEVDSKFVVTLDLAYPKIKKAVLNTYCNNVLVVSPSDSLTGLKKIGYKITNKDKNQYEDNAIFWNDFFEKGLVEKKVLTDQNYDPNRGLLIVHTGGTTGKPKGVMLSSLAINTVAYECTVHCIGEGGKWLDVMPPFIAYGFIVGVHTPLSNATTTIIIPNIDPKELGKLFIKYKPNYMAGVPTHYETLIKDPKVQNEDLSFMKLPCCGGDAMSIGNEREVNDFFKKHGVPGVVKGYGLTEGSALCSVSSGDRIKEGSVGYPMGLTMIACFDTETQEEVPLGQEGEICITGPNLMLGYYNNQTETDNILKIHKDGKKWIHTGDIGVMDNDGYIFIKSRIKRVIIRYDGFKIFSKVIEDAISKVPEVNEVSAVAVRDITQLQGNTPVAFFTLKDNCKKSKDEMLNEVEIACKKEIPEYCLPTYYAILDKMPYTNIGKIDYRKLELKASEDFINEKVS